MQLQQSKHTPANPFVVNTPTSARSSAARKTLQPQHLATHLSGRKPCTRTSDQNSKKRSGAGTIADTPPPPCPLALAVPWQVRGREGTSISCYVPSRVRPILPSTPALCSTGRIDVLGLLCVLGAGRSPIRHGTPSTPSSPIPYRSPIGTGCPSSHRTPMLSKLRVLYILGLLCSIAALCGPGHLAAQQS